MSNSIGNNTSDRSRPISNGVRVLQIGTDRTILDTNSASAARMREYGEDFGSLDIIIFSLRRHNLHEVSLSEHVHVYPTNSFSRALYLFASILIALKLPRPDVISAQDPFETGFIAWIIAVLRGCPLHVQVHTDFLSPEYERHSFLNWLRVLIAGFVLRRAKRIRVVSERIKISLEKKYSLRAPMTVLPIFVDVERFRNASVEESLAKRFSEFETKLLVVSRLEPEKNVGLAIRAFAKSALEDSCLIILGEGSEKGKLQRLSEEKGVSKWVFFEGGESPIKYYKIASLVLAPSLYEGYGMVIVEALASGVPVLSTDVGIAREAGAIIAEEDDFAKAIRTWFESGSRAGELKNYPYKNFDEYAEAYCDDIMSSAFS